MAHDTTQAIIRVFHLCKPDCGGNDGAIPVENLKAVLQTELADNISTLGGGTVDDILWDYMRPDSRGMVGFLQYWQGMEEILEKCGTRHNRLSESKQQTVEGFCYLRQLILGMAEDCDSVDRADLAVHELRFYISKTIEFVCQEFGPGSEAYWCLRSDSLPSDDTQVTGDELACALLTWLEELVNEDDGDDGDRDEFGDSGIDHHGLSSLFGRSPHSSDGFSPIGDDEERDSASWTPVRVNATCLSAFHGLDESPQSYPYARSSSAFSPPRRARREDSGRDWGFQRVSFGAGLTNLLGRMDRHPGSPTKDGAAEYRDSVQLNVALKRRVDAARADNEPIDLELVYRVASEHFANNSNATRRKSRAVQKIDPERLKLRAVKTIFALLLVCIRRRRAHAISAWLTYCQTCSAVPEEGYILQELLCSQSRTAVLLEKRVKLSSRAGGLALSVAGLQRSRLRSFWVHWRRNLPPEDGSCRPTGISTAPLLSSTATGNKVTSARLSWPPQV